jgi:diguanylate cyclase (GGDEF)-like protein
MRRFSLIALACAVVLLSLAIGVAVREDTTRRADVDHALTGEADQNAATLDSYFNRARSNILLTAHNPAFRQFYSLHGTHAQRVRRGGTALLEVNRALAYLEHLYPGSIGEACFIDFGGPENARVVRGNRARITELTPDESANPFFAPTFALRRGQVYQARPYVSPDTHEWVISNSTPLPGTAGAAPAIVHFEVTIESFRRTVAATRGNKFDVSVVDARTGRVVLDGDIPQRKGAPLGPEREHRFRALIGARGVGGVTTLAGRRIAYRRVARAPGNVNNWFVAAVGPEVGGSLVKRAGPVPIALALAAFILLLCASLGFRVGRRELQVAANTDSLTGLGNRRELLAELECRLARAGGEEAVRLLMYDLNGFKAYNDTFGHPAGDVLLARLGGRLAAAVAGTGTAFRLGGDEFCVLAAGSADPALLELATLQALTEHGEGFDVSASFGNVVLPREAPDAAGALRLADQRMYAQKQSARPGPDRQSRDVLMSVLSERHPDLGEHMHGVAALAEPVAARLGLVGDDLRRLHQAAELHDVGKLAIPDAILTAPRSLEPDEWAFMRRHTIIGERIISAAPALAPVAKIVRSTHERVDGDGYPDGLAGDEIPLEARIIAVCDAYDAMVSERPYGKPRSPEDALTELRACAGTQFDPAVVDAFADVLAATRPVAAPA